VVTPLGPCRPGVSLLQGTDISCTSELEGHGVAQGKISELLPLLVQEITTLDFPGESGCFEPPREEAGLLWLSC